MLDDDAAEQRTDDRGNAEDGAEQALHLAALARGNDVSHHGHGDDHEAATAETLNGAGEDKEGHGAGHGRKHGADQENDDGGLQHDLATVEVAELAINGGNDGGAQEVGDDHPSQVIEPAELTNNGRKSS